MIKIIKSLCFNAIINKLPKLHNLLKIDDINISQSKNENFHFQFNSAMKISKIINYDTKKLAEIIKEYINYKTKHKIFEIKITDPGFINFKIKNEFINKNLTKIIKIKTKIKLKEKIIIDYSSPNIAKDMHVGHLRSTIVGDCLARILKYVGHTVIKICHLGDWGTQFGMLIAYIKDTYEAKHIKPIKLQKLSILYKEAQLKYENDLNFKAKARNTVLNLQNKEKTTIKIWDLINKISKNEYKKIYNLLEIKIKYKGEAFYNDLLIPIIKLLEKNKLITLSNNAKCVYTTNIKNKENNQLPLIVQKSDGGFNYASTDLAALYYRIKYHKANKIIYITDAGQSTHFKLIFETIEQSNINKFKTKLIHIPLGLMLTHEGKRIKTRSGQSEKLINLLKNSIAFSKKILLKKNKEIHIKTLLKSSKILGINTIKYSELSNNINQNYIFDYKKILQFTGNTASFLNYAYVRIKSIKRHLKNKIIIEKTILSLKDKSELDLAIHLIQYNYIIEKTINDLNPNILTLYLYKLSEKFHVFFHECNILNSDKKESRLTLCDLTQKILKTGMQLLGLKIIEKM